MNISAISSCLVDFGQLDAIYSVPEISLKSEAADRLYSVYDLSSPYRLQLTRVSFVFTSVTNSARNS